jgi:hypothetical protein
MLEEEVCGNVVWHSASALCVILEKVIAVSLSANLVVYWRCAECRRICIGKLVGSEEERETFVLLCGVICEIHTPISLKGEQGLKAGMYANLDYGSQ